MLRPAAVSETDLDGLLPQLRARASRIPSPPDVASGEERVAAPPGKQDPAVSSADGPDDHMDAVVYEGAGVSGQRPDENGPGLGLRLGRCRRPPGAQRPPPSRPARPRPRARRAAARRAAARAAPSASAARNRFRGPDAGSPRTSASTRTTAGPSGLTRPISPKAFTAATRNDGSLLPPRQRAGDDAGGSPIPRSELGDEPADREPLVRDPGLAEARKQRRGCLTIRRVGLRDERHRPGGP